jgi:hypothetical protein
MGIDAFQTDEYAGALPEGMSKVKRNGTLWAASRFGGSWRKGNG